MPKVYGNCTQKTFPTYVALHIYNTHRKLWGKHSALFRCQIMNKFVSSPFWQQEVLDKGRQDKKAMELSGTRVRRTSPAPDRN